MVYRHIYIYSYIYIAPLYDTILHIFSPCSTTSPLLVTATGLEALLSFPLRAAPPGGLPPGRHLRFRRRGGAEARGTRGDLPLATEREGGSRCDGVRE